MSAYTTARNTALGLMIAGSAATLAVPANAATPSAGSPINGWTWALPDGTTQGTCPTGYTPQWSEVTNLPGATFWAVVDGTTQNGLTWAQMSDPLASKTVTQATAWGYNFEAKEITEAPGFKPVAGHLYEGDCVLDGTALPVGPYPGGGKSLPILHTYTRTMQVDTDKVTGSAWFARRIAGATSDGLLKQGELKAYVWGTKAARRHVKETSRFVTVTIKQATTPTASDWATATGRALGVTVGTAKVSAITSPNSTVTYVWALADGSTTKAPFKGGAQTYVGSTYAASAVASVASAGGAAHGGQGTYLAPTVQPDHTQGGSRRI